MRIKYNDGQPCEHRGCLSHISHPCEGCGRISGKGVAYYNDLLEENLDIIRGKRMTDLESKVFHGWTDILHTIDEKELNEVLKNYIVTK